jgi:molybdopterin synthase catalytic subunit
MSPTAETDWFELVQTPIDPSTPVRRVRADNDGAIVIFDGFVRNESHGRRTLYLEYEAYTTMALAKMREIGEQIHAKFPIHRVAILHRLGRLEIGETLETPYDSEYIRRKDAALRAAGFEVLRYEIDPGV